MKPYLLAVVILLLIVTLASCVHKSALTRAETHAAVSVDLRIDET